MCTGTFSHAELSWLLTMTRIISSLAIQSFWRFTYKVGIDLDMGMELAFEESY
jgi:hypothetical protein